MTRSSNKELIQPFDEPERVFHSNLKLFKTSSLHYSSLPELDLFSEYEDQSEGEVAKTMTKPTLEEYMIKTREGYGSGISRPKSNANEHIEKVLEIVDLFHIPNITQDQVMLEEVISFYKGLDVPTRQILDSKGAIPSMKADDAKKAIQDMADHSKKWHNGTSTRTRSTKTSDGLAAI
ncbi:hypothetical protein Tco_0490245 [Tanacetum coccineum]